MELIINAVRPQAVSWNYSDLKNALTAKLTSYEGLVYSEDQIGEAKKDRSELNALKRQLNDERIRQEKEYMEPFNEFKSQVKELCTMIDKAVYGIDEQVKEAERQRKAKKEAEARQIFEFVPDKPGWLQFEQIEDPKWLNASTTMISIKKDISALVDRINTDIQAINQFDDYTVEAIEAYKKTLNIADAISEIEKCRNIAKIKAEREEALKRFREQEEAQEKEEAAAKTQQTVRIEPDPQPAAQMPEQRISIRFVASLTRQEAQDIVNYFNENHIQYRFERGI